MFGLRHWQYAFEHEKAYWYGASEGREEVTQEQPSSYAHEIVTAMKSEMDWDNPTEQEKPLIALYALLAMTKGAATTAEDVHDAWSVWTAMFRDRPDHPSLVPFCDLTDEVKALDDEYVEAIHRGSRRWRPDLR